MKYGKLIFKEMELKQKSGNNKMIFTKQEWEKFLTEVAVGVIIVVFLTSIISFLLGMGFENILK